MSNTAETYFQAGIEATHGTPVAADRKIYALGSIPREGRQKEYVDQSRASYEQHYDAIETHSLVESWSLELPAVSFDDLPWWLQLAVKGGVTPTGAGPYTWTFNNASGSEDLDSATFEAADNVGAFQLPYAMVRSWEMTGEGGSGPSPVGMTFDLMAQKLTAGHTMTAALSERDLRGSYMAFKNTELFIDDTAGGIGGTELDAALESFTLSQDNRLTPRFLGGGNGYYEAHGREKSYLEFVAVLLFNSDTYSEFQTNFQGNVGRYVQLKNTGGNDVMTVNLYTKLETFEFDDDGPTRRVALMGRSLYDPTLGYGWQIEIDNDIASI